MPRITNKNYKQFLDNSVIDTISKEQVKQALENVTGRFTREGKALLIILYLTGARPNEVLNLRSKDITKLDSYVVIKMPGSKGGKTRPIYLHYKNNLVKIVYKYSMGVFPEMYLFYNYRSNCKTYVKGKEYTYIAHNLGYHFKKWFKGVVDDSIPPYFLRHNRFSKMAERDVSMQQIQGIKGAKTIASVEPYVHMSTRNAKKLAKYID